MEDFKKTISEWAREFINENDGSILTEGSFEDFLQSFKPIEKMFTNIAGVTNTVPKQDLINSIVSDFKNTQCIDKSLSFYDEQAVRDLFCGLYARIDSFFSSSLSLKQKYVAGLIEKSNSDIKQSIKNSEHNIENTFKESFEKMEEKFDGAFECLKKMQDPINPGTVREVYDVLANQILQGEIKTVQGILPLIKNKNKTLE